MSDLWKQRLNKYQGKLLKYLRFVFNDHFVIALFFLFGAICYGYFQLIDHYFVKKTLMDYLIAWVVLFLIVQIGKFATLIKKPDVIFLLPKDYAMNSYLKFALYHGCVINILIQSVLGLAVVPFLIRVLDFNLVDWILILASQCILKCSSLIFEKVSLFNAKWENDQRYHLLIKGIIAIVIGIGVLIDPIVECILSILFIEIVLAFQNKMEQGHVFKWNLAIEKEEVRMTRIYKFFSLFTDVPEVEQNIKRRKYLDRFLPQYKNDQNQTYPYLYWRAFWRSPEYSGLFIRLTLIGAILTLFINLKWLSLVLALLFVYLTGFQLLPLYEQFDDIVFTYLYPITKISQKNAFKNILQQLLFAQGCVFALMIFITFKSLTMLIIFVILLLVLIQILTKITLKHRFEKMA